MDPALLDTDILSEVIKGRNATVTQRALAYANQYGTFAFRRFHDTKFPADHREQNATTQMFRFDIFCQRSTVLAVTDAVLDRAADLWVEARRGGHPHGDADLIIAATAIVDGRTLITGNTAHFQWIAGTQ